MIFVVFSAQRSYCLVFDACFEALHAVHHSVRPVKHVSGDDSGSYTENLQMGRLNLLMAPLIKDPPKKGKPPNKGYSYGHFPR